jgi:hypothetical protein
LPAVQSVLVVHADLQDVGPQLKPPHDFGASLHAPLLSHTEVCDSVPVPTPLVTQVLAPHGVVPVG